MTDDTEPKGRLPATSKELSVYRRKPPAKSLLEQGDALLTKTWGKDPKFHAVLTTRICNGTTVEGTPVADNYAGAMYFRQLATAEGNAELAALPLAKLKNMIGTLLRRYDFTPLELE